MSEGNGADELAKLRAMQERAERRWRFLYPITVCSLLFAAAFAVSAFVYGAGVGWLVVGVGEVGLLIWFVMKYRPPGRS